MGNLMFYIWGRLIFCWDMFYNNWKHIGKMLGTCSESSFDGLKPLFPSCRGKPQHWRPENPVWGWNPWLDPSTPPPFSRFRFRKAGWKTGTVLKATVKHQAGHRCAAASAVHVFGIVWWQPQKHRKVKRSGIVWCVFSVLVFPQTRWGSLDFIRVTSFLLPPSFLPPSSFSPPSSRAPDLSGHCWTSTARSRSGSATVRENVRIE